MTPQPDYEHLETAEGRRDEASVPRWLRGGESVSLAEVAGIAYLGCGLLTLVVVAVLAFALGRATA